MTLISKKEKSESIQYIYKLDEENNLGVSIVRHSYDQARITGMYEIAPIKFDEDGEYEIVNLDNDEASVNKVDTPDPENPEDSFYKWLEMLSGDKGE